MSNIACVYWIRNREHNDITKQGYIGVSYQVNKRLNTHIKRIQNKKHGNPNLVENVNSDTVFDILIFGLEDYCYQLEAKLRPQKNIGWNLNAGGTKPPSQLGVKRIERYGKTWAPMEGKKHSEITKHKMSKAAIGKPKSEDIKKKISITLKQKVRVKKEKIPGESRYTPETLLKMSLARKGIPTGKSYNKGTIWWNDGIKSIMSKECPGTQFVRGRIPFRKK